MARGEMLPIQHAARALGVPDHQLRRLAELGSIPGAVERDGEWLIPTMALVTIAKQQGWTLDLAALQQQLDEREVTRYAGDVLAAQAAVLLAKTQATAARVESRDLFRRLREASDMAATDRAARIETAEALAESELKLEESRRHQAVAEARLTELRQRLNADDQQFSFMIDRINTLEQERHRLNQSLGWLGRLRYRRLLQRELTRPSDPATTAAAAATDTSTGATTDGHHQPVSHPVPAAPVDGQTEPPIVNDQRTGADEHLDHGSLDSIFGDTIFGDAGEQVPEWAPTEPAAHRHPEDDLQVPSWATVTNSTIQPTQVTIPEVAIRSASTVSPTNPDQEALADTAADRPHLSIVGRTPDGRFDQSALSTMRASEPLPAQ